MCCFTIEQSVVDYGMLRATEETDIRYNIWRLFLLNWEKEGCISKGYE